MGGDAASSRHFELRPLGRGIHAAIATDGGWAVGNAGIVDLGDRTVVFDTFANPVAAEDLRVAAERATGRPVSVVVNSHPHRDHIRGNQVFPRARIVATTPTRDRMAKVWNTRTERVAREGLAAIRQEADQEFRALRAGAPETPEDARLWDGYRDGILEGLTTYEVRLPDLTFDRALTLHGSERTAEVLTFGGGHSPGDALLHIPEERTAFLGDLLFIGYQPYLADGDPDELFRILDRIEGLGATTLIPGHGPPGASRDLGVLRSYIEDLRGTVRNVRASGGGLREACATSVPAPFDRWRWQAFRRENFEFLLQRDVGPGPA